ncbi:MAG: alpha/beta hydrolase [Gammaproteobacteria bacterium]|jgi:pimeloyl-ACP methyl ester carboxylesterase
MSQAEERIGPPALLWQFLEGRAMLELGAMAWLYPLLRQAPRGDGHPVLVIPGFLASGSSTFPLRHFLKTLGYAAHRWKQGRNLGGVGETEERLVGRLKELRERYGRKVSVIGWSLGGMYARELAWIAPDHVRQVITMGSPFRNHTGTAVAFLYEDVSGQSEAQMDPRLLARLSQPPPVPATSIYTRTDGVVHWRCSLEHPSPTTENIRVPGSHCGLGHNPLALWAIADRLAQPEGDWQPFRRASLRRFAYPRPDPGE